MKPRITVLNSASVSVLAEGDVLLPCKATGNPEPSISWTKVSTGRTIVAYWYVMVVFFPNGVSTSEGVLD